MGGKNKSIHVIGWDCASQCDNNGLVLAKIEGEKLEIIEIAKKKHEHELESVLESWLNCRPLLVSLDTPLGWPRNFGKVISSHMAADLIDVQFYRETDNVVRQHTGQVPLAIGADKIAISTLKTLDRLDRLRKRNQDGEFKLLWNPQENFTIGLIEVYPAATLKLHKIETTRDVTPIGAKRKKVSYKDDYEVRTTVFAKLREIYDFTSGEKVKDSELCESDHILDALICALAGMDFINNKCLPPQTIDRCLKEGWIWVRKE